jgi:hypothetical protein
VGARASFPVQGPSVTIGGTSFAAPLLSERGWRIMQCNCAECIAFGAASDMFISSYQRDHFLI